MFKIIYFPPFALILIQPVNIL